MILDELFRQHFGQEPVVRSAITGSGSSRAYFRMEGPDGEKAIGTIGTNIAENDAFLYLDGHFRRLGLPVPQVLAVSADRMAYIQEDLGDTALLRLIDGEGFGDNVIDLMRHTVALLPEFQYRGAEGLDFNRCFPVAAMDRRSVMWDLNYFKYSFLKAVGPEFDEPRLEDDMERFAGDVLDMADAPTFMYRDFQSRNVMINAGKPWFIDFQGGRRGPALYDLASFLWQAKAGIPDALRHELAEEYRRSASRFAEQGSEEAFFSRLHFMALFRTIQVLGAYGFRGIIQNKPHFISSIAPAVENLRRLLPEIDMARYPELSAALGGIASEGRFKGAESGPGLTVEINSFGFRKSGIPRDFTGNGGGFVFDCRAITNPGRIDRYKALTGLDAPVREFLESNGEILSFLSNAKELVGASVERYKSRGFSNLKVSFGCTGGQHRSVYSAQAMAEWINRTFGVAVELHHIEQNIHQSFPAL